MATPAQIAANRKNAQHSIGPRTERGKAAEYDLLLEEFTAEYHPAGPTERFLVEQLAQVQWKLQRIARMEAQIFARHMEPGGAPDASVAWENDCAGDNSLVKLSRYEATARRDFMDAAGNLQDRNPAARFNGAASRTQSSVPGTPSV